MVESSILGTSPWNSDPFLCKDLNPFPGLDCQGILDMGFTEQENSERLAFGQEPTNQASMTNVVAPRNDDFWASCDEDLIGPLTSDSLGFESLNWTADSVTDSSWNSDSSCDVLSNLSTFAPPEILPQQTSNRGKRNRSCGDPLAAGKSWSRMTSEEQLGTVEALTQIISHQMGLREQLEVIKIIDPAALVSSADTEFVIDLGCLDDRKLQRIRSYVLSHALELSPSTRHVNMSNSAPSVSSQSSSSSSSSNSSTESTRGILDNCFSANSKLTKKQLRDQHKQIKAWHQRQHRQKLKEKKSGLFVREEVVSLTTMVKTESPEIEETEDIDILA